MPRYATILCHTLLIFAFPVLNCGAGFAQAAAIFARDARVGVGPQALVVADFNGDGKPDIATANASGSVAILLNNGDGTFANGVNILVPGTPSSLVTADFNGDGKPDLAVSAPDSTVITILLGNSDGTFRSGTVSVGIQPAQIAVGDFNGDGRPDIVAINTTYSLASTIYVLSGRGDGTFLTARVSSTGDAIVPRNIVVADFDGDGKSDLAVTGYNALYVTLFYGKGDGTFGSPVRTDTSRTMPLVGLAAGDVNGDGRPDLVSGPITYNDAGVFTYSGSRAFRSVVQYGLHNTSTAFALTDMDGDGKQDMIAAENGGSAGLYYVGILRGNGDGTFQNEIAASLNAAPNDVKIADVNGDGKPDVIAAERNANRVGVLLGNGDGTLQAENDYAVGINPFAIPGVPGAQSIAIGDFNRDGKLDFVVPTATGVLVVPGNGDGTFGVPVPLAIDGGAVYVAVGDVNGDGKPDIATSNNVGSDGFSTVSVLIGNGDGSFQSPVYRTLTTQNAPGPVAIADLKGDGKPSVLVSYMLNYIFAPSYLVVFSGWTPNAAVTNSTLSISNVGICAVGDFNGDGRQDVLIGNAVYLADAFGNLQKKSTVTTISTPFQAIADFNGDGKLDVAIETYDAAYHSTVQFGNGDGTFGSPLNFPEYNGPVVSGDFNGDGKQDIVYVTPRGPVVYAGNGNGSFLPADSYVTGAIALAATVGDFNGDGKPDVLIAAQDSVSLLLNVGPPTAALTGTVTLDSIAPNAPAQNLTFEFRPDDGSAIFTRAVSVLPGGAFSLGGILRGKYHVRIVGAHYLARVVPVDLTNGTAAITPLLLAGDGNGDNRVDIGDFGLLVNAYNTSAADPKGYDSGYDVRADFNSDGVVDIADFGILVNNYDAQGDK